MKIKDIVLYVLVVGLLAAVGVVFQTNRTQSRNIVEIVKGINTNTRLIVGLDNTLTTAGIALPIKDDNGSTTVKVWAVNHPTFGQYVDDDGYITLDKIREITK